MWSLLRCRPSFCSSLSSLLHCWEFGPELNLSAVNLVQGWAKALGCFGNKSSSSGFKELCTSELQSSLSFSVLLLSASFFGCLCLSSSFGQKCSDILVSNVDEKIKMLNFLREKKVLQNTVLDTFSKSHCMLHFHLLHHCERDAVCVPYSCSL